MKRVYGEAHGWMCFCRKLKVWIEDNQSSSAIARGLKRFGWRRRNLKPDKSLSPLTPCKSPDHVDVAARAMDVAFADDDVRNIAVSGRYASGKSSFLRWYFRNYNVLWVSLASFVQLHNSERNDACGIKAKKLLERDLEISILQQMFYTARASEIPFSRAPRTKIVKLRGYLLGAIFGAVGFMATLGLVQPNFLVRINKIWWSAEGWRVFLGAFIIWICILIPVVVMFIRDLYEKHKLTCRMSTGTVEIGFDMGKPSSVFNKSLDDIIYYFSTLKFDAVIFEDIDRFNNPVIFTKLREINQLLNAARQVPRSFKPIRFVYALRDDMFPGKERVKFFDFIIPIVPIVDVHRALSKFTEKIKPLVGEEVFVSKYRDAVKIASRAISDMRLLNNICNEFQLYRGVVHKDVKGENLFAMIVYKNLLARDFDLLHEDHGFVADIFNLRDVGIKELQRALNDKIKAIDRQISQVRAEPCQNAAQLSQEYIVDGVLPQIGNFVFMQITSGNVNIPRNEALTTKGFEKYAGRDFQCVHPSFCNRKVVSWDSIEKCVAETAKQRGVMFCGDYETRKRLIEDKASGKIRELEGRREEFTGQCQAYYAKKFKDLLLEGGIKDDEIFEVWKRYTEKNTGDICILDAGVSEAEALNIRGVIVSFIKEGYITEKYRHYLTLFSSDVMNIGDYEYVLAVSKGEKTDPAIRLADPLAVMDELVDSDCQRWGMLNYDLLRWIIQTRRKFELYANAGKAELILEMIGCGCPAHLHLSIKDRAQFICDYLRSCEKNDDVVSGFCTFVEKWPRLCEDVLMEECLPEVDKAMLVALWLGEWCKTRQAQDKMPVPIKQFLERTTEATGLLERSGVSGAQLKGLLQDENLRLWQVDFSELNEGRRQALFDCRGYALTHYNVCSILRQSGGGDELARTALYTAVMSTGDEGLKSYVHDSFAEFLENAYLKSDVMQKEDESIMMQMLNREDLGVAVKRQFISKCDFVLNDLENIKGDDVKKFLIEEDRVVATWHNITVYYGSVGMTEELVAFVNRNGKSLLLDMGSHGELRSMFPMERDIVTSPLLWDQLAKEFASRFVDRCSGPGGNVAMSEDRMRLLIGCHLLQFGPEFYSGVKAQGKGAHICLAVAFPKDFCEGFVDSWMSDDDLCRLIKTPGFPEEWVRTLAEKVKVRLALNKALKAAFDAKIAV